MESETYISRQELKKNTGKLYFEGKMKDSDLIYHTRGSPMGTVFGINHQGMVIPI